MLAKQEKEVSSYLKSVDFFKTGKPTKSNYSLAKKVIKPIISAAITLQALSLVSYISAALTHYENSTYESKQVFDTYRTYQENVKKKDYKEATYNLNHIFNSTNSIGNLLALGAVNITVFDRENNYPNSFIEESISIAKKYHHAGINSETAKLQNSKACSSYDPGCQLLDSFFKKYAISYNTVLREKITESYYRITHVPEYKEFYNQPVSELAIRKSPYQLFKENNGLSAEYYNYN